MRVQKLSLAAVALAAGLSVTACQGGDDASAGAHDSSSAASSPLPADSSSAPSSDQGSDGGSAPDGNGSPTAKPGTGGDNSAGSGTNSAGSATCKTSQLAMSVSGSMAEGDRVVHLKNTGSDTCTLKGFPGVDLKGKDGTFSADRSKLEAPTVNVKPGAETRFTLHAPRNDSGGHGVTMTSMVVTPPNETHSKTLRVGINLPVTDKAHAEPVRVDPVGTGK